MILKTKEGLAQVDRCPCCNYMVTQDNMIYRNGKPLICQFCKEKERGCTDARAELVIAWSVTPEERADAILELMLTSTGYYTYFDNQVVLDILIRAIRADRSAVMVKLHT